MAMASRTPVSKAPSHGRNTGAGTLAPAIVHEVVASPGEMLAQDTRADMERRFNHDFSRVRIHTDVRASESAAELDALAYTVGNHVVFDQGEYAPDTAAGRQNLAHELVHVMQQSSAEPSSPIQLGKLRDSAESEADQISQAALNGIAFMRPIAHRGLVLRRLPRRLADIPTRERRAIQVSTLPITVPTARIDAFFHIMPSGNPSESFSIGARNSFASNIPAALHTGLGSIGAWLAGQTNALPLNSSIEVDLDLSNYGGSRSTYRFTYFSHAAGRVRRAPSSNVMLIELIGNVIAAPAGQAAPANTFTIGTTRFNLSGSWSNDEYAMLRQALSLLPAGALTAAAGVTFSKSGQRGSRAEAGNYDQTTDTISLHNNAFPAASMRIGQRSRATFNILHEIGHALDLRELSRAWSRFNTAGQTVAARRRLLRQRSLSGSRYVRDTSTGDYDVEQNVSDTSGAFRQAARRDQIRQETGTRTTAEGTPATLRGGITSYSDTDYQELFAEAFALYISAPETLRLLRPNIYSYFNRRYPRPRRP